MDRNTAKDIKVEKLRKTINSSRDILNELCSASDGTEKHNQRLIVSQYLDELIVEYMNEIQINKKE